MTRCDAITFSLSGWEEVPLDDTARAAGMLRGWSDELGNQLSLHRHDLKPDLVAPLSDLSALREQYRHLANDHNGAIVSVDRVDIAGLPALKVILKLPQDPSGMTYVGSFTFPFENVSYVIRVICQELGTTGMRDAVVAQQAGGMKEDGIAPDWFQDPYDPSFKAAVLRNKSDDEEWDSVFPEHPLSRVRASLDSIAANCRIASELRNCRPYTGPSTIDKVKQWWRRHISRRT